MQRSAGHSRLDVIGISKDGQLPLLDTIISLPKQDRTVDDTVNAICLLVSEARGVPVVRGGIFDNGMALKHIAIGADNVMARDLLSDALSYLDVARVWMMDYDSNTRAYAIGIDPVVRVMVDSSGRTPKTQLLSSLLQ